MDKKYDSFIELAPGYESVVDLSADNDAEFWSRYIVTDDMVNAVKTISKSLKPDDPNNDVLHFWLKGSYGTGKTYSAIVLKHLLQDDYTTVENFLTKNKKFVDVKDKFLGARKKGPYYVKFRSGECLQLNTSNKFLFQIEQSVRDVLKENGFEYTGSNSLVQSVQEKTRMFKSALAEQFEAGEFPQFWGIYESFEDFASLVESGDVDACSQAQEILESMDVGLATDLNTFKQWITDVFNGNPGLSKTGIFIIWDEFTEYIRHNDLDIIQQLSLFCKEQPLYIIYVIHEYPGLFSEEVGSNMGKADARFHKIDISITEDTTRRLIGESILVKDGMKSNWDEICDDLYGTISSEIYKFMDDPDVEMDAHELKKIFPIHPMSVELVTKVAGLAAAGRSIFIFLKSHDPDGFRAYIRENGYYDWKWVTADYLWDYYFVNNSGGKKTLTKTAEDCLKHYVKSVDKINDEKALRIFKAAMLLLATVGSGQSMKKSKGSKGIQATQKTLYDCFCGAIDNESLGAYLESLSSDPLNVLVLAPDLHDGYRLELPFSGPGDELDVEKERLKQEKTINKLFDNDSFFGSVLKKQFAPDEKAVVKRLAIETCWGSTQQINSKFVRLKDTISKSVHKFGMLLIAASNLEEITKAKATVSSLMQSDDTNRMVVCIIKHCLSSDSIEQWYDFSARASLAHKNNKIVNAKSFNSQAEEIVGTWVSTALGKDMDVIYGEKTSQAYTNKGVIKVFENIVFNMYPCAPEGIIKKITLYKSASQSVAYYGFSRTTMQNKNPANDKQKNFSQQWQDVVDVLRDNDENIWDCSSIEEIIEMSETKIGRSMSALCKCINTQLTAGTVFLTDLWEDLQNELGYYDTSVCCYLLGFVFKFFEGKYTWHDGNNAHKLDEETVPVMITSMLTGKSAGMKISSESDVEKRFKQITQRVFGLSDDEIGDVYECRKYVKVNITKNGFPIWAIKYIDAIEFNGVKEKVCEIIDRYVDYILEIGGQSEVMEDIVALFKVNVKAYTQVITTLLKDKQKLNSGLENFIFSKSPEAKAVCESYNFSSSNLTTMLSKTLEEEIWQWREDRVEETINKLVLDLKLVGIINKSLNGSAETVEKTKDTLSNYLGYIKVPGCVYAGLDEMWAPAVQTLYDISINKWVGYTVEEKEAVIETLESSSYDAIENIDNPIGVLKRYISKKNMGSFSETEIEAILDSLPKEAFTQTESNFKNNIQKKIEDLGYTKKVRSLQSNWKTATGFDTIKAWTEKYSTPAAWVVPDLAAAFATLRAVEANEHIDITRIENAIVDISETDLSIMGNPDEINKKFITNVVSKKHASLLLPKADELRNRIKMDYKNVNSWPSNIVSIREIANDEVLKAIRSEAISRASKMNETDLRKMVDKLLNNISEACLLFMDED